MRKIKHWQDAVNAVIGLALVATALGEMLTPKAWKEWTEAILGLCMGMSPWVLGFSTHVMAMDVAVACGALVVLFALRTLANDKDFALPKSMQP